MNSNPDLIANLQALRSVLLSNSVDDLTAIQKPFNVSHAFNAKEFGASFLFFKWQSQRMLDQITVKSPEGFAKDFIYRTDGVRYGKDYQTLAADILEGVIREKTGDDNTVISNPGGGNPGDTLYGTSVARVATFEAEKDSRGALNQAFVNVTHRYKGWKIDRAGAEKIVKSLNDKYKTQFFWPEALSDTKSIELYNIDLQIYIYSEALVALASMSPKDTKEMLMTHGTFPMSPKPPCLTPRDVVSPPCVKKLLTEKFIKMQSEYLALQQSGKALEASAIGLKMVSTAESMLPGNVFVAALGGPKNVFIQSRIQGFREKDEAGETTILSNTLGQIGASKSSGPLHYVQNNLQMTESEFFINWLITPL
ncbi:MAG: hypothetical protein EOP04_07190 [Proteobacteria bacterium]|nr:MAG: hypothetical protein EOP04_07190 [Pseudomonadota bacterium]